jgi:hypothetical protein
LSEDFIGEERVIFWLQSPDPPVNTMTHEICDEWSKQTWMDIHDTCLFRLHY